LFCQAKDHDESGIRKGELLPAKAKRLFEQIKGLSTLEAYQTSPMLRQHELEAYRIQSFLRFYRLADDAGFSSAVRQLYKV
jgi:hypothetical protein